MDFIDIVEETIEKTHPFAIIYFVIFFLVSLIVCNIALSIVIEWYSGEQPRSALLWSDVWYLIRYCRGRIIHNIWLFYLLFNRNFVILQDCLNATSKTASDQSKKTTNQLIKAIITRAKIRVKQVEDFKKFASRKSSLADLVSGQISNSVYNFDNILFTKNEIGDHRLKFAGDFSLDLSDLKLCQKYASINLEKGYKDFIRLSTLIK